MSDSAHPSPAGRPPDVEALVRALSAPFEPTEVKFKPGAVSGHRALALAYVDARVIQDRLDEVLGVLGWQDSYKVLPDGSVMCRLRIRLGDQWITKVDVGGPSEQPDGGDRTKAAFSDALKRAAVKFGVGRYLYRLPALWADYDPQRRQFVRPPVLPAAALPSRKTNKSAAAAEPAPEPSAPAPPRTVPARPSRREDRKALPANGEELRRRLEDYDRRLAAQELCAPGDLVAFIILAGEQAGHGKDLAAWTEPAIRLAVDQTRVFEAKCRQEARPQKEVA